MSVLHGGIDYLFLFTFAEICPSRQSFYYLHKCTWSFPLLSMQEFILDLNCIDTYQMSARSGRTHCNIEYKPVYIMVTSITLIPFFIFFRISENLISVRIQPCYLINYSVHPF
jgi:hypothetical protein